MEPNAAPPGVHRRPALGGAVALLYLALAGLLTAGGWRDPSGRLLGAPQDAIQHIWFLRWVPYAIAHGQDPLLTRFLDHPGPINLMWNNATPLLALVAAPVTLAAGPVAAYLALLTLALTVSAWAAYLLAARLVRSRAAAVAAGLTYGFSPYVLAQAIGSHLPLVTIPVPPLLVLGLHELLVRRRSRPATVGVGLGLLLAAQLLTNEELLLTEVLMGAVTLCVLAALHPGAIGRSLRTLLSAARAACLTFAACAALPLLVQFAGPARLGAGPVQPSGRYVADLLGFVVPTAILHFAPAAAVALTHRFTANLSEWDAYLGLPLVAVMGLAPLAIRRRWAWAAAASGLVAGVLALGPVLHVGGRAVGISLPWGWLARFPGFRDALPDRLTVYVFLVAALLLAGLLDRCRERWPGWAGWLGFSAVAAAALLPLLPRGALPSQPTRVPAFFRSAAVDRLAPGMVALVAPIARGPDDRAMLWQAASGMRFALTSGYALHPGLHHAAVPNPPATPLTSVLDALQAGDPLRLPPLALRVLRYRLQDLHTGAVVVGPMRGRARVVRLLTRLLERPPTHSDGVDLWLAVGRPATRGTG